MKCNLSLVTVAIIAGERGCKTQYDFERRSQEDHFLVRMCYIHRSHNFQTQWLDLITSLPEFTGLVHLSDPKTYYDNPFRVLATHINES